MNDKERFKRDIKAPCKMGKDKYAGVNCNYVCNSFGWNPNEVARRFRTGKIVEKNGVRKLVFKA